MPLDKGDYEYTYLFRFLRDGYVYNLSLIQLSSVLLFLEKANEFSQFSIRYCNTCGKDEFLEIDALNDIIKFLKENKASNRSVYKLDFAGDSFRIVEEERERNENKDFNYLCNVLNDLSSASRREGLKLNEYFCDIESNGLINYFKIYNTPKEVQQKIESEVVAIKEKAEENNMSESKLFPKLKFGKLNDSSVKISHLGVAIKNKEDIYVSYDKSTKSILNVDILSVDADSLLYAIPIQISDIKEGDCILHNGTYYYIRFINNNNVIKGVNYYDGVEEVINITTNIMGFNFVTKVMSIMDFMGGTPGNNPTNNMMLPLLLSEESSLSSSDDIMKIMLMTQCMQPNGQNQQGNNPMGNMFNNPMMMLAFAGGDNIDTNMLLMCSMMQMQQNNIIAGGNNTAINTENN